MEPVDTLVVGAGVIGSSVAMHLARLGVEGIRVIDFDLEGAFSSSELNAGGVRATWNQPLNVAASRLSISYFAERADELGYRPCGYLWLRTPEQLEREASIRGKQSTSDWPVEIWDLARLRAHAPFLDKAEGLGGAVFAQRDGLINPNLVKTHYRAQARARRVEFDDRSWVVGASHENNGIRVQVDRFERAVPLHAKIDVLAGRETGLPRQRVEYRSSRVVNCAGPWASAVARALGYASPSVPVRRQVSVFDCREVELSRYGMIVEPGGVYFHPEASNGLAGFADPEEPPGVNFEYDGESFFNERIWPALFERSSAFERLRHLTGWAGLYEVSPDESAIVGQVRGDEAGARGRVYEAHSFSGHGVMHSYAAGLALAELMAKGRYETLDFNPLSGSRFERGALVRETLVI